MIRRKEEGNETFCARSFLLDGAIFWNSMRLSYVSRYEKKMKDNLDDEIKLAGLESLNPQLEPLANIRGCASGSPNPSDIGSRGHSDPMDVDAVNSLSYGKGKGSSSPRDWCFKCGGPHFQRDCNARKNTSKQSSGKGTQSKSWSKKGQSKRTEGAKGSHKCKTSKTGLSSLENSKSEASSDTQESAQTCPTDTSWNDGWNCDEWNDGSFDEWNNDWSSVGWHEGWEQTYDTSSSFRLEVWMSVQLGNFKDTTKTDCSDF